MLPLEYPGYWRLAGLTILLGLLVAALLPAMWLMPDGVRINVWFGLDKWVHALAFAFLTVWFSGQYQRRSYWRVALGLAAYGVLMELCQSTISYRSAEWYDFTADVIGIAVGLLIAVAGLGGWSQRVEGWYRARKTA